jgi:outer membrane receptor protein involved in Fe transport
VGAFAEQTWQMHPDFRVILGGRADYWQIHGGRRVEQVAATRTVLTDAAFPDRDGVVASGRLGTACTLRTGLEWHSAAYTGFRVPTLNELYRPFRVRNDITGANDTLEPEKLSGVETGLRWEPLPAVTLGATVFWNHLQDAVANVTLLDGPGTAPDGTFVPEGGVYRQRQNIDAVRTAGVELEARWQPAPWLDLSAGYLFTDTEVDASSPALNGRELAQAPAHVVTAAVAWRPHARWHALLQARYGSEQFEDDLNSQSLASYIVWDASLTCRVHDQFSVGVVVENLFDRTVETGKSGDGLVSIGAPRWVGVKMTWEF